MLMLPSLAPAQNPCDNPLPDSCRYPDTCCARPWDGCPWRLNGLVVGALLNYFKGGFDLEIYSKYDVNCNCRLNGIDITYFVNYFTGRGPEPICCFYICGRTPTNSAIGDFVWLDGNENGVQDSGEVGIAGVAVDLVTCSEPPGVLESDTTDSDGHFLFTDILPGDYRLRFALLPGYEFSAADQSSNDSLDSDADRSTGLTSCVTLAAGDTDLTWDAGMFPRHAANCTRSIGFWKNRCGFGPQPDLVSPFLPLWLGVPSDSQSVNVTTPQIVFDILIMRVYGTPSNGITKLYAQLLGAKLNIENGADGDEVLAVIDSSDGFLASHAWTEWPDLSNADRAMVLNWMTRLDNYNSGIIGPGPCDNTMEK